MDDSYAAITRWANHARFSDLALFLVAALLIAITPGPGIFYVAARMLAGGRAVGLASSFGTGVGGLVHVVAEALGMSALVMASAEAFTALRRRAFYLIWLGLRTWREAGIVEAIGAETTGAVRAFREGILVEALNPKTAAFFLAFIPQFVDVSANLAGRFIVFGLISVVLNTGADVVAASGAARAEPASPNGRLLSSGSGRRRAVVCGLEVPVLFARRSA